jgi:lipopolysaccharide transport system ATP-binding protein
MACIDLDKVGLTFRVRRQGKLSLKEYVLKRMFRQSVNPLMEIRALHDVSLQLRDGDRLGIIGHNGAGKSVLLRLLAGVYPPTAGRRTVAGSLSSLFDFTLGFQPELNGWENMTLRVYLQGETRRGARDKMGAIAAFSELGEFLDMPIRHYSAGMLVRLGFAISTTIDPEILLIDEILSAGDMSFQAKAQARMQDLLSRAKILALVSHDLDAVLRICNQVAWMDHGRIRKLGPAEAVIAAYRASRPQDASESTPGKAAA